MSDEEIMAARNITVRSTKLAEYPICVESIGDDGVIRCVYVTHYPTAREVVRLIHIKKL